MDWFWEWLARHVFYREDYREGDGAVRELQADNERMIVNLDARIKAVFTPEDWAETKDRCERKLAEMLH